MNKMNLSICLQCQIQRPADNTACQNCGLTAISTQRVFSKDVINYIFEGSPYFALDNFYEAPVMYEGLLYTNSEAAFQSAKLKNVKKRKAFTEMSPGRSKYTGKTPSLTPLRSDWDEVKDQVMYDIVKDKMLRNPAIRDLLISTGNALIIEGNYWADNYWGVDFRFGVGRNQLGVTLMRIREEFKNGTLYIL